MRFIDFQIKLECGAIKSFCDLFAGTGAVAHQFNTKDRSLYVNDLLYSNYLVYVTWFSGEPYRIEIIKDIISELNSKTFREPNYVSENFADSYFTLDNAFTIGGIREHIEGLYIANTVGFREYAILVTSLIYAIDKSANTCGHFDAYRKVLDSSEPLKMKVPVIDNSKNSNNKIFNKDANVLAKEIQCDVVYLDPPYNSRQYGSLYHLLENIACWQKPELIGITKKMRDRAHLRSLYCTKKAPAIFEDLIESINARYIVTSYNNMGSKGSRTANAKISEEEIVGCLEAKGEVKVFSKDYKHFSAGRGIISDHKELLYICRCHNYGI